MRSLQVGFVAVGIALGLGVPIGLVSGFYGGIVDSILMRMMDVVFSVPGDPAGDRRRRSARTRD